MIMGHLVLIIHVALLLPALEEGNSKAPPVPNSITQPVSFSHRVHIELGLECTLCHVNAKSQDLASLPGITVCMSCHSSIEKESPELQLLRAYADSGKAIPWVRVYQLPFFVFFSHKEHLNAGVECQSCHGPVRERDLLWSEGDISMTGCVDCHHRSNASMECNVCHELNQ